MPRPSDQELRELLSHSLLRRAAEAKLPLERRNLTFDETFATFDGEPFWDVFSALSKLGVEVAASIDFLAAGVLPPPEDREFPILALGLSALFDTGPIVFLKGVNARYGSYFRLFSGKLTAQFTELPEHLAPWARKRWEDDLGLTTDQWIWAANVFMTPFVHSEVLEWHDYSVKVFEDAARALPEVYPDIQDPYAEALEGSLREDIYAFPREVTKGIPTHESLGRTPTFADAMYWYKMIDLVHRPVIKHFGRYPYRNLALARDSTDEEKKYLDDTDHFAEIDKESAALIREDVERGVWRPLQRPETK